MSGSKVYDPSKLHLKKELTQIRKSARAFRDPGTCSSLKSPLSSTRSATAVLFAQTATNKPKNNSPFSITLTHKEGKGEKRAAVLYNWRSKNSKSSSEKSLPRVELDGEKQNNDVDIVDGSSSSTSARLDDCSSDVRNGGFGGGDSKSDSYVDEIRRADGRRRTPNHTTGFRCGGARLTSIGSPTMAKRSMSKVKLRKALNSSSLQKQRRKRLKQVGLNCKSLKLKPALGLSQDDSVSLIDQSDDTEEWCNSDELCNSSAMSPFLSRLMQQNFPQSSKKLLKGSRKGDSSYTYSTPALSTSSFSRYFNYINPISSGSWDGTIASLNDEDDDRENPLDLPGRKGCGIPCYWSRRSTPKYRAGYGCCSPSLSDTLLRKGSVMLCGSQKNHNKRHGSSSAAQGRLPLLNCYDGGGSSFGTGNSDDELSMNFGEIDLEGMSRLDGRRWSFSCRSREAVELPTLVGDSQDESMLENVRSLSQKYRPMSFSELVGQTIVVNSLVNAVARARIAPVHLFQGPRGTGKTSTAKIFAAALNCLANEGTKPCGVCRKCSNFISCKSRDAMEVNGANKKGIDSVRYLLKKLAVAPPSTISSYKIFVIDDCHLLSSNTWAGLLKFLEEPLPQVVFIFITTDLENLPRVILSRCQKHLFNKIKDVEIVSRLQRIAAEENLDVEPDALELIAVNADGSLRDAETMLEQLSLLGKRITAILVNELVGIVSDEKLLELLELAISSNTAETVKRARELLDSGAEPLVLMSQLASLIMDIIAGNYLRDGAKCNTSPYGGRSLTEVELEKFKNALKLLSEAEKHLRVSSERSTWFTAMLLQLGSFTSPEFTLSGSSRRQSSKTTEEDQSSASRDRSLEWRLTSPASLPVQGKSMHGVDMIYSPDDAVDGQILLRKSDMEKLDRLWLQCIERCHYEKLRQLLQAYGKLISLSEVDGVLLAYIAFEDDKIKARADRYRISITNSLETVLRRSVEVRIMVLPAGLIPISASREGVGSPQSSTPLPLAAEGTRRREIPMQRIESIIGEQRRPERNQVLPRNQVEPVSCVDLPTQQQHVEKDCAEMRIEHHPISPSLLHQSNSAGLSKEYLGYESGPGDKGCKMLFCCYNRQRRKGKVNQGTPVRQHKGGGFLCFGECCKSRHA